MKKIMKRIVAFILCTSLMLGGLPVSIQAADTEESKGYIELNDGYLSVKVSEKNGGFLVDTVEGDKLNKSDNNKFLLYPDEAYDTSFTSFRIERDGKTKDYIFGRNYSFLGLGKNDITVEKTDENTITTVWKIDGLEFTQTMMLLEMEAQQHGMVYITYAVKNTSDKDIEDIQARIMMDTALGYQDYAVYMAGQADGSYTTIKTERTLTGEEYSNYFFAYDDEYTPSVTSYTLNASVGGETIVPTKVTFAHWNSLAASVFDYEPEADYLQSLNFTNPYNEKYMTADSATAMYYDMGQAAAGEENTQPIGVYYGVYSNALAEEGSVALNFAGPSDMLLNDEANGYVDLNGDAPGNFTLTAKVQNTSDKALDYIAVAFKTPEGMVSFDLNGNQNTTDESGEPFYVRILDLQPGEVRDVTLNFLAVPTKQSDYRKIQVEVYDISSQSNNSHTTLLEENKLVKRDTYILCPSVEGEELSFLGTSPEVIYVSGTRNLQFTGTNFGLLRDTSAYRVVLRPVNGGADVIVPASNVVINTDDNTATLVLDQYLSAGTWNIIIDWNDTGKLDLTSDALRFVVSDKEMYKGGTFGVITMDVSGDGTDAMPYHYTMNVYRSEEEYQKETGGKASKDVLLVLRGDFTLQYDDKNKLIGAEAIVLEGGEAVSINECLDVTKGRVTISIEFDDNGNQTAINTDIDGAVYTTGANTKVWDGVCAITSLEEGELVKFPVYKYDGELSGYVEDQTANTNSLMLLWPGAASTAQTIAGMIMELRYAHFGIMATEPGAEADKYVVSFGAQLSPNFLIPNNFDYGTIQTPAVDIAMLHLAKSNYLPWQLRDVQESYQKDLENWGKAGGGGLDLRITDILYGGGFIGFNTSISVGLPAYTDGFPAIEGTLNLKVIGDEWAVGVEGSADIITMEMEAELALRSHNSIPVLDKVRFQVGGMMPGAPVDTFGVFWIRGAGAGIDNLYETFFVSSTIPPLTLLLHGEFAIYNVLSAEANVTLSGRGISADLQNVGISGISLLDYVGGKVYWYPRWDIGLGVEANILDVIHGSGSIVVQEIPYENGESEWFWEAFLNARVEIPLKYPLIGGMQLASADLGLDGERIFGAIHVLQLDAGVTYYWGGDVDFAVGKYDTPEQTMPMVYALQRNAATGQTLYMAMNNVRLLGSTQITEVSDTEITSNKEMTTHNFVLDSRANEDALLSISFVAENTTIAQSYKDAFTITYGDENDTYALKWYDNEKDADSDANKLANARYVYDTETKTVNITLSITDSDMFDKKITVKTPVASQFILYGVKRLANLDSVTITTDNTAAVIQGSDLETFSQIHIFAVDEKQDAWKLAEVPIDTIPANTAAYRQDLSIPETLPSGEYVLKVVGVLKDEMGEEIASPIVETEFTYTNPNQPEAPSKVGVTLGGDYTLDVTPQGSGEFDGYIVTVYEQESLTAKREATMYREIMFQNTDTLLTVGGQYQVPVMDENGKATDETKTVGLEAGKYYVVGVKTYNVLESGNLLCTEETFSPLVQMEEATKLEPVFEIKGAVVVETAGVKIDTIASEDVTVSISGMEKIKNASYTLNDGEIMKKGNENVSYKDVSWDGSDISFTGLENGVYVLSIVGENENGDSFGEKYQFAVDVKEPRLMISSPIENYFRGETLLVSGLTDAGATVTATVKTDKTLGRAGIVSVTGKADESGSFILEVPMDMSLYQQTVQIYAKDAVGNLSRTVNLYLVNALAGSDDAKPVLLINGKEEKEILANGESEQLEFAIKVNDQLIHLNNNSMARALVNYELVVYEGEAEIDSEGVFTASKDAVGMVRATLDGYEAALRFNGASLANATITLVLPENGYVYDEQAKEPKVASVVLHGVTLTEGKDYTVSYADNIAAGKGTVLIEAVEGSEYMGIATVEFVIAKAKVEAVDLQLQTPVKGETPQTSIAVLNCEKAEVVWTHNGDVFTGKFEAGKTYTAQIILTADANHFFADSVIAEGWTVTPKTDGSLTLVREYTTEQESDNTQTYLVTFIANNQVVATRVVEDGATLMDIPEIPEKIGHTQTAPVWSVTDFRNIHEDMTVHAIYTPDVYTITFVIDGKVEKTMEVGYMDTVEGTAFPVIPEKEGYTDTPAKWDVSAVRDITADATVTAIYTPNQYSLALPDKTNGYTLSFSYEDIYYDEGLEFTIAIDEGYNADDIVIKLNGLVVNKKFLTAKDNTILVKIPSEDMKAFFGKDSRALQINIIGIISEADVKTSDETNTLLWFFLFSSGVIAIAMAFGHKNRIKE